MKVKTFSSFVSESEDQELSAGPMTVKDLMSKLNLMLNDTSGHMKISEDDYVMFCLPGEDEGILSSFVPVENVTGGTVNLLPERNSEFQAVMRKEGASLTFFAQKSTE